MTTTYEGKRITPEEVEAAYRETGLRPSRRFYFMDIGCEPCGCGLGVLMYRNGVFREGEIPQLADEDVRAALGIESDYRLGFVHGFDGGPLPRHEPACRAGHADGIAAAARVFHGAKP